MKLTALVENTTRKAFTLVHGLSFYIETEKHRILFDLGPDHTLFENAKRAGIDLKQVDTVILSHGHKDHGGALKEFLEYNPHAKVYVQKKAFEPHFSILPEKHSEIGLDRSLMNHPSLILLEGDYTIDDELLLFTVKDSSRCHSDANDHLYTSEHLDTFDHEMNLMIFEKKHVLIQGCGHTGIVNILNEAKAYTPDYVIGGYHLYNRKEERTAPLHVLSEIAEEMNRYPNTVFYTCHCTGEKAYTYLHEHVRALFYLHCGDILTL